MGLAASQARLLLLTSRRSDLEYRAQMISQHKIALAMETEQVATAYTQALNDRHLVYTYWKNANNDNSVQENLSYKNITTPMMAGQEGSVGYRVVNANGEIVVPKSYTDEQLTSLAKSYVNEQDYKVFNYKTNQVEWKPAPNGQTKYNNDVAAMKKSFKKVEGLENAEYFQELLQHGMLQLQQVKITSTADITTTGTKPETNPPTLPTVNNYEWSTVVLSGAENIAEELNTENDNAAMAKYEMASKQIQAKDKQLDVELKQVETQLEACKSEQESVKKLIQDRAQNDFKSFA